MRSCNCSHRERGEAITASSPRRAYGLGNKKSKPVAPRATRPSIPSPRSFRSPLAPPVRQGERRSRAASMVISTMLPTTIPLSGKGEFQLTPKSFPLRGGDEAGPSLGTFVDSGFAPRCLRLDSLRARSREALLRSHELGSGQSWKQFPEDASAKPTRAGGVQ